MHRICLICFSLILNSHVIFCATNLVTEDSIELVCLLTIKYQGDYDQVYDSLSIFPDEVCEIIFQNAKDGDSLAFEAFIFLAPQLDGELSESYKGIYKITGDIFYKYPKKCVHQAMTNLNFYDFIKGGLGSFELTKTDIKKFEDQILKSNYNFFSSKEKELVKLSYLSIIEQYNYEMLEYNPEHIIYKPIKL